MFAVGVARRGTLVLALLMGCSGELGEENLDPTDLSANPPQSATPGTGTTPSSSPAAAGGLEGAALSGEELYAQRCASCHGALQVSQKRGKSAAQIRDALTSVSAMQAIKLSDEEIVKLEAVLQTQESIVKCRAPELRGGARASVRRLTRAEIDASLTGLVPGYWTIQPKVRDLPELDEMSEVSRFDTLHSKSQVRQWADIVSDIGDGLVQNPGWRAQLAPCLQADTIDGSCWRTLFTDFGKKVFRRPVGSDEANRLAAMVEALPTANAVYLAAHLLFRAPDFLLHIETGTREEGPRVRLSSYEIANRIAFAITGAPPDATLIAEADKDALQTLPAVEAQVRRLIDLPIAKAKLQTFFAEWLQLSHVARPNTLYLDFVLKLGLSGGLEALYAREIDDYLLHMIWKEKGTFSDLMTRPIAFPRYQGIWYGDNINKPYSALAGIYGDDKFSGFTPDMQAEPDPFPAPNHPGLAMRAGFLSGGRFESSPILRGVFVLRRLLCETLPSPDFNVVNSRLNIVGAFDHTKLANFDIVNMSTASPECSSCHSKINPVGFAMEAFDMVGRARSKELVYDQTNLFQGSVAEHDLPYPVVGLNLDDDPTTVNSPQDLANALAASSKARACMSIYLLRHLERRAETVNDGCALSEAVKTLADNEPVLNLFVRSVANEDIFWRGK